MTAFRIQVGVTAHTGLGHLLGRGLHATPPRGRGPYTGSLQIVSLTSGFFRRFKLMCPMYWLLFGPLRKTELLYTQGSCMSSYTKQSNLGRHCKYQMMLVSWDGGEDDEGIHAKRHVEYVSQDRSFKGVYFMNQGVSQWVDKRVPPALPNDNPLHGPEDAALCLFAHMVLLSNSMRPAFLPPLQRRWPEPREVKLQP